MGPEHLGGVVLTGGAGARLGGVDKAGLLLGGRSLLDVVLGALGEVPRVVVVGGERPTGRDVVWAREEPVGSGPAAGLLAGVQVLSAEWVAVLAVDLPFVTAATVRRLVSSVGPDGALLVDASGRRQFLCAVYHRASLVAAAPEHAAGTSMRALVEPLSLAEVPAEGDEALDVDTLEQLERLRSRFEA